MLENCFAALASGGQLFYLTCTLSPEENQRQVARFLDSHPAARLAGSWTTPPDVAAGEFFYAASLQKVGE
jgi:16S rRNA (cytosine967-C5)-methyltransferase